MSGGVFCLLPQENICNILTYVGSPASSLISKQCKELNYQVCQNILDKLKIHRLVGPIIKRVIKQKEAFAEKEILRRQITLESSPSHAQDISRSILNPSTILGQVVQNLQESLTEEQRIAINKQYPNKIDLNKFLEMANNIETNELHALKVLWEEIRSDIESVPSTTDPNEMRNWMEKNQHQLGEINILDLSDDSFVVVPSEIHKYFPQLSIMWVKDSRLSKVKSQFEKVTQKEVLILVRTEAFERAAAIMRDTHLRTRMNNNRSPSLSSESGSCSCLSGSMPNITAETKQEVAPINARKRQSVTEIDP